jgi:hypothetical protein
VVTEDGPHPPVELVTIAVGGASVILAAVPVAPATDGPQDNSGWSGDALSCAIDERPDRQGHRRKGKSYPHSPNGPGCLDPSGLPSLASCHD